jgi:hypothetical protein
MPTGDSLSSSKLCMASFLPIRLKLDGSCVGPSHPSSSRENSTNEVPLASCSNAFRLTRGGSCKRTIVAEYVDTMSLQELWSATPFDKVSTGLLPSPTPMTSFTAARGANSTCTKPTSQRKHFRPPMSHGHSSCGVSI